MKTFGSNTYVENSEDVYIINMHLMSYKPGIPAKIIGVKMYTPSSQTMVHTPRLVYEVVYPNGFRDQISFQSLSNGDSVMMTITQMVESGMLKITQQ